MAGIKITIVDDVTSFLRGTENMEKALDDVADSLDDVARDAQKAGKEAGTDLAKGVDHGTDDASDSLDSLTKSFREMAKSGSKYTKDVGDDVAKNVKKGTDDAGESTSEFKDEARANFSEVASSFSGDMTSAVDLVQGTLGGLAGSLTGPVGLGLGGLALLAGTFATKWQASAEATKQAISDMYDDMLASGADFLSKDYIADQLSKIYQGADDAAIKVKQLRDLATDSSIPEPLLARALVGDQAARDQIKSEIAAQRLKINEALDDATAKGQNIAPTLAPAIQALQDIEDKVDGTSEGFTKAQQNADAARAAIQGIQAPLDGVASSAEDARSKFDGIGRKISELPPVKLTADTTDIDRAFVNLQRQWRNGIAVPIRGVQQPV